MAAKPLYNGAPTARIQIFRLSSIRGEASVYNLNHKETL